MQHRKGYEKFCHYIQQTIISESRDSLVVLKNFYETYKKIEMV